MSMTSGCNEVRILLVEDDQLDVELIKRAFHKARIGNAIDVVRDGVEALALLKGSEEKQPFPRPYLVLLDLNMPRMNGIEFLNEIRKSDTLKDTVVFVLSTSDDDRDKLKAYEKNVAGYIVKSNAGQGFIELVGMLDHYWRVVEMPPLL